MSKHVNQFVQKSDQALRPEFSGAPNSAPPPLRTLSDVGPFRILLYVPQGSHHGAEHWSLLLRKLEIANEIVNVLASVAAGRVYQSAHNMRDARFCSQGMSPSHHRTL